MALSSSNERWHAVTARDRAADGRFVYAVRTTGIFCRPSCASRPALRKNVVFFDTPADAAAAGFRPCKRCAPASQSPESELAAKMISACRLLEESATEGRVGTEAIAKALAMSPFHFHRQFKAHIGVTPQSYLRRVRVERAKASIGGAESVTTALYAAGYASSSRFYAEAGEELGMRPKAALLRGSGEEVRFAIRPCSLGEILVAWTSKGVCDVRFADTPRAGEKALRARFAKAELQESDLPRFIDDIVRRVNAPKKSAKAGPLPLDIRGTAFQQRVWEELRRIPVGETRTYTEVAVALGAPNSARAVARACATNELAVVVPCHRVVRADEEDSGYRWGIERKRALLAKEATGRA